MAIIDMGIESSRVSPGLLDAAGYEIRARGDLHLVMFGQDWFVELIFGVEGFGAGLEFWMFGRGNLRNHWVWSVLEDDIGLCGFPPR